MAELWGDGLSAAVAGMPAYFALQLRDKLANPTADGAADVSATVEPPPRMARAALEPYVGVSEGAAASPLSGETTPGGKLSDGVECTLRTAHEPAETASVGRHEAGLFSGVWRSYKVIF